MRHNKGIYAIKQKKMNRISQKEIIEYETTGHWLSQYMWNEWSQRKLGRYIGRKTVRKYRRYLYIKEYRSNNFN